LPRTPQPLPPPLFPYTTLFRSHYPLQYSRTVSPRIPLPLLPSYLRFFRTRQKVRRKGLAQQHRFRLAITLPPTRLVSSLGMNHLDRKSTRLNSSHVSISYAVFC